MWASLLGDLFDTLVGLAEMQFGNKLMTAVRCAEHHVAGARCAASSLLLKALKLA